MTPDGSCDRHRNIERRFKNHPVTVGFALLAIVLFVFGGGMATAAYRDSNGLLDWWRASDEAGHVEHHYNPRHW